MVMESNQFKEQSHPEAVGVRAEVQFPATNRDASASTMMEHSFPSHEIPLVVHHVFQRILRHRDHPPEEGQSRQSVYPEMQNLSTQNFELIARQVVELIQGVSKYVKDNEPGTLRYEITRDLRPGKDGNEDVVMIERYVPPVSLGVDVWGD